MYKWLTWPKKISNITPTGLHTNLIECKHSKKRIKVKTTWKTPHLYFIYENLNFLFFSVDHWNLSKIVHNKLWKICWTLQYFHVDFNDKKCAILSIFRLLYICTSQWSHDSFATKIPTVSCHSLWHIVCSTHGCTLCPVCAIHFVTKSCMIVIWYFIFNKSKCWDNYNNKKSHWKTQQRLTTHENDTNVTEVNL